MRIIAGSAGGRRLEVPPGTDIRPTSDRAREALFNALVSQGLVDGATVLDLFAGTGALGLEALSRGARHATFVDRSTDAVSAVRANLDRLGFADRATVIRGDAMGHLAQQSEHYDLALLDPPYDYDAWPELLERVDAGVIVVESDREIDVGPRWSAFRHKRYAGSVVTLARVRATPATTENP